MIFTTESVKSFVVLEVGNNEICRKIVGNKIAKTEFVSFYFQEPRAVVIIECLSKSAQFLWMIMMVHDRWYRIAFMFWRKRIQS